MSSEFRSYNLLKDFIQKGKIGDGSEVVGRVMIKPRFFQNWCDSGNLKIRGDKPRGE